MVKLYSPDEVALHNNEKDIWMIIHGGVYDLTKFLQEHPGGEEVLLTLAGTDGTVCFDDMGHTGEAIQLRETYKIGEVAEGVTSAKIVKSEPIDVPKNDSNEWMIQEDKQKPSILLPIFVGIFAIFYALLFYYLI